MALSYDEHPYLSDAILQTHPMRLAALAHLHGMDPAPPVSCRVLEIGCGDGGNLLPIADVFPDATFVGVDSAASAIRRGRKAVEELGLSNLTLLESDLRDLDADRYDYIIAHGVYSWVPADVRDALLRVIGERLAENGVAYVSYNLLPGWHVDRISRDLMRFHLQGIEDPNKQIEQGKAFLNLAAQACTDPTSYHAVLEDEIERLSGFPDWFLLHDHLGEHTTPVYFRDFAAHAASHGLSFLTEADFETTTTFGIRSEVAPTLEPLSGDRILFQQYLDYLRGGRFRRTLLCRTDAKHAESPQRLEGLLIAAPIKSRPIGSGPAVRVDGLRGQSIRTDQPVVKSVLERIGQSWPRGVAYDELLELGGRESAGLILSLLGNAFLELRFVDPPVRTDVSDRPLATRVARRQARESTHVTSAFHRGILIDDERRRRLIQQLDGDRTLEDLTSQFACDGVDVERIASFLRTFARDGLLVG